jgi:MYXO-CTERM domain-containing protein
MMTTHDVERARAISIYEEHDALGPDVLLVHAVHTDASERAYLARTGTPVFGLALTFAIAAALVLSGQVALALNIAVFALVALYLLHSVALLLLPRWNPELFATVEAPIPLWVQRVAGMLSIVSMAGLLAIQLTADVALLRTTTLRERAATHRLTTIELAGAWGLLGLALYGAARRRHSGA